jgi:hypothetical protein
LDATCVDNRLAWEMNGICAGHLAFLTCSRTRWLASPRDWWWVVVFLGHIAKSQVESVER